MNTASELVPGFEPETELERAVSEDPILLEGLAWGKPRKGHPEGSVGAHVADLLQRIEDWGEQGERREQLRFVSLVHDALKFQVKDKLPHRGEWHHAMRARRFAERYTKDERLLSTIELHDRHYGIWRRSRRGSAKERRGLDELAARITDPELFLRFLELDGSAEGKKPEPVEWFREELAKRQKD